MLRIRGRWEAYAVAGLLAWALGTVLGIASAIGGEPSGGRPRLAVVVIFDQLRGDYLSRWQPLFGDDGFRRLQRDGAWFSNCHYPYALTITGPGHASIGSGCLPARHGIVANEWYDRAAGGIVYCAASNRYRQVPAPDLKEAAKKSKPGRDNVAGTPELMLAPGLGDALKAATGGKGRAVSLSFKDRSAILPVGHKADACYWFDPGLGQFVTSTFYRDGVHPWIGAFNASRSAERWFSKPWTKLRPDLDYAVYSGPDDAAGEGLGIAQGRVFPHPLQGGKAKLGVSYYEALYNSPFGNDLLLELAKTAIDAEGLGTRDTPDLLSLSFSSNDAIGHCWGPDSQEVLDVTLRSDRLMADLLNFLDRKVGRGRYVLGLSADHGVCPLPEVARARGLDAQRIAPDFLGGAAEAHLRKTFGGDGSSQERWIEASVYPWIYLRSNRIRARDLDAAAVEASLARWLMTQAGVYRAFTRTELLDREPTADAALAAMRKSFHPDRCGDVVVLLKPYYFPSSPLATGTGHGTPHDYDTHVPLLIFGSTLKPGTHPEPASPLELAGHVARAVGISPPAQAEK